MLLPVPTLLPATFHPLRLPGTISRQNLEPHMLGQESPSCTIPPAWLGIWYLAHIPMLPAAQSSTPEAGGGATGATQVAAAAVKAAPPGSCACCPEPGACCQWVRSRYGQERGAGCPRKNQAGLGPMWNITGATTSASALHHVPPPT